MPAGLTVDAVSCGGKTLTAGTDYSKTTAGIRVQTGYLGALAAGSHTLTLSLSDGSRAGVTVTVSGGEAEEPEVRTASFDRYYLSDGFRDVRIRLDGVSEADVKNVVLGLTRMEYEFDAASRAVVLRRGALAQLRAGVYTVTVDLASGGHESVNLTVQDSTPSGVYAAVAEYNTFAPTEPRFSLPLDGRTVAGVTAVKNGAEQVLTAGTDYRTSGNGVTITQAGAEKFRQASGCVAFTATLSDSTVYTLVIDYI